MKSHIYVAAVCAIAFGIFAVEDAEAVYPFQKKCRTSTDSHKLFYELILDINDNPLVRRFWTKSRLRKNKRFQPDANRWAKHHLDITIVYKRGGQTITEHDTKEQNGNAITWSRTISGGFTGSGNPTGGGGGTSSPEEVRPISMKVVGTATRDGRDYHKTCEKAADELG